MVLYFYLWTRKVGPVNQIKDFSTIDLTFQEGVYVDFCVNIPSNSRVLFNRKKFNIFQSLRSRNTRVDLLGNDHPQEYALNHRML